MHGSVIHTLDPNNPVRVSMGRGAPLHVRVTGADTFVETSIEAYEVR
ncbi:hypothetical protein VPHD318_0109 [Vibrio phage D318]